MSRRRERLHTLFRVFLAAMIVALLAIALVALRAIAVSHRAATAAARADLAALEDAAELQGLLYQKGFAAEYFLTGDERWLDELRRATPAFERWLASVTRDAVSDDAAEATAQLVAAYGRYDAERERAIAEFKRGERAAAIATLVANSEQAARLRDLAESLIHLRRGEVAARLAEADRAWQQSLVGLALAVVIAVVGAAASGYLLARQMARRIAASSAALAEQRARLSQAEKMSALGEMATAVAHEVLNPLTGVKTAMQLLARTSPTPEVTDTAAAVDTEIRRVEVIARRLMSFARPLQPHLSECGADELIEQGLHAVRTEAAARGVRIESHVDGVRALEVDRDLLLQVLVNLLVNACQATPSGGTVRISLGAEGDWQVIRVRDEGPGISPAMAERLFSPFATDKQDGHGLGLALSQNIALAHGGRIEALGNQPERGATFVVWLPGAAA